ncbi:AraC family transcriptional regulator [Ciceribacter naphthalenivorans]|uniref:AraC family transcriptional regulator n=3 Tax=Pseudomonadota TaxID=1224 RepID=A0A512HFU7_9HYPH|nr:AraC family transcriptional regulator [Ciceribacter naphthalenivorans]GLR24847.1 AraC family transcriptional regulator [Ciceribacter naphthalenivorans]GLT07703.1 AraC family transcriptional regulator [Sphingomonas psychrolutea]
MIFIPLSFAVSLFLVTFLVRLLLRGRESLSRNRLFVALIAVYAVQTMLVGLRWGYGVTAVLPLLSLLASVIPPLSYLAFRDLVREEGGGISPRDWPHLLPTVVLAVLLSVWRDPVDLLIIGEFLAYGLWLLWLARLGPDGLIASRLDGSLRSYRSLQLTGVALVASALTDVGISLDMLLGGGRHSALVVSAATTVILLLLGIAAAVAGAEEGDGEGESQGAGEGQGADLAEGPESGTALARTLAPPVAAPVPQPASDEHEVVAANLDRLMDERRLYADTSLNLGKLARRMGLPARAVSQAVNRVHRMSVSQYVNNFRVAEACRLLSATDMPVTRVVFEAGFMTKSNFNREFLRVTGLSPTAWREAQAAAGAAGTTSG